MRKLLLATTAALGLAASFGAAHADAITVDIWNGATFSNNATEANIPSSAPTWVLTFFTSAGLGPDAINWQSTGGNTFTDFFKPQACITLSCAITGGTLLFRSGGRDIGAVMGATMSTQNVSTFMTLVDPDAILPSGTTVTVVHENGASAYENVTVPQSGTAFNGGTAIFEDGQQAETSSGALSGPSSNVAFTYSDDNGALSHLTVTISAPAVPEPASLTLFGSALVGLGWFARRPRKTA